MAADLQPTSAGGDVCESRATCVSVMPEYLNLSQSAWTLLDLLQQQLGVSSEVFDSTMRPLTSGAAGETISAIEHPAVIAEVQKSLRTGDTRIDRSTGVPIGIFPLRVARQIVGCVVVSPRGAPGETPEVSAEVNVEGAGHLARMALEADLALTGQLSEARYRTRRMQGVLRFLLQLGAGTDERAMANAVVQAASVWFDVDCRVYQRYPDGSYELTATLPSAEQRPSGTQLDASRAEKLVAARRMASAGDLEDLGLVARREEVLALPVGTPQAEWLLLLSGTIDQEVELTFGAIARILAGELLTRATARIEAWQQRLAAISDDVHRAPERVLLRLVEALASQAGAIGARVTLIDGAERVLAAVGQSAEPSDRVATQTAPRVVELTDSIRVTPGTTVRVSLTLPEDARRHATGRLTSWMKALQPWLREVVSAMTAAPPPFETVGISPFERRIQEEVERAKRFNLGLGLVLIRADLGPSGDLALDMFLEAVRPALRASDLLGRVRSGLGAVLLVHSESGGADVVFNRVRERLSTLASDAPVPVVHLGKAMFSAEYASAEALIAQALRDAQSLILRN